jgi:dTDP-glucose 4,6-dehydratase
MTKGKNGNVYHVAPSALKGVYDINESLLMLMPSGKELFKGYVGKRLKDDDRYAISATKMQFELGWIPKFSWEDGMKATILWYTQNKVLW